MKTVTIRQLNHDLGGVLHWVEEGESVCITKRGKIVALLSPPPPTWRNRRPKRPDFAAQLKRIYGDKVFSTNLVVEDRQSRPC
jgi:prevent-host-death family protein